MTSRYFLHDNDKEITDMKEQVKAKDSNGVGEEQPQKAVGNVEGQARKKCPKRGKRYSRAQKDEIMNFSLENSIAEASVKFDVTETTIYEWNRTDKGSRKNNFAELALRFGPGLADPREKNHRNSKLFRGF